MRPPFATLLIAALATACTNNPETPQATIVATDSTETPTASTAANGPQVIHTKDGGRMEGMMTNGARTGTWLSYFPDGGIRSRVAYVNGKEEGPSEVFHPNSMPYYTGQYWQGITVGEWVFFDPTGKEVKRVVYDSSGVAKH
ncbi:MAG: hypothetical protein JNL52_07820 [Flavobacteriales bacterium]|nr:hypothetical protein [Flavobacteriales bacterium]